jgi:hypothetical protein
MTDDLYMYKRFLKGLELEKEQRLTDLIERLDRYRLHDNAAQRYMDSDDLIEEALDAIHYLREKVRQLRVEAGSGGRPPRAGTETGGLI